jgi:serine/threonine-protein kinase RsbW
LRTGEITLSIDSQFGDVFLIGLAVHKIASSIPVSDQSAFEMELAVVEAVNNAVEHAHHFQRSTLVTVRVGLSSNRIKFTILDSGAAFDFEAAMAMSAGSGNPTEAERGRGLKIMDELMDEVKYERSGETNQITLVKYLNRS